MSDLMMGAVREGRILAIGGPMTTADVDAAFRILKAVDIRPREAVGICFDNGPACVATYIALAAMDAVAVPQSPVLPETLRRELWLNLGCRYAIEKDGIHRLGPGDAPVWPDDVMFVVHSSGSEGIPKAIPLTAAALKKNAEDVMQALGMDCNSLHLGSMSQCYTNGLYNSFLLPVLTGGRVLIGPIASALNIRTFVKTVRTVRPDLVWINPTVLTLLRRSCRPTDIESVKLFVSCTAPLRQLDCLAAEREFGKPVLQSYGLSETLIVSLERPNRDVQTEFSAGEVVGGVQAVELESDGTLTVRNGAVFPGYASIKNSGVTFHLKNGIPGKSFVTGDLAQISPAGRLFIIGRRSNTINVAGTKIGVEQIEDVLLSNPLVLKAVVAAIEDRSGEERPAAMIQTNGRPELDALADRCAEILGPAARPLVIHVVPEIPVTANGKLDRRAASAMLSRLTSHGGNRAESRPLIVGLSHIFGETRNLPGQVAFWENAGLRLNFRCQLPVPDEKREKLLHNKKSDRVDLSYMSFGGPTGPRVGIEMISHLPLVDARKGSSRPKPGISLFLNQDISQTITDPDGNQIHFGRAFSVPPTVTVTTPDAYSTGQLLSLLGFMAVNTAGAESSWSFQLPLFPKLSVQVILKEDESSPAIPKVDEGGWNGLSFLVSDLSFVSRYLPLCGHQTFETDSESKKEIAFYAGNGLLLEFLMISRLSA